MRYFLDDTNEFEKEMYKVKGILIDQGYVLESDHRYAYLMQYADAFNDIKSWLHDNGYDGDFEYAGIYEGVAVYCLYDSNVITYDEVKEKLLEEARMQYDKSRKESS